MELYPTYSHNHIHMQQTTPNIPSAGGYQSQAAPKRMHRTLLHSPSLQRWAEKSDSRVEAFTCLLSQLSLPSQPGER